MSAKDTKIVRTTHPDRLNSPLKRVGERGEGKWQKISWDGAFDLVEEKLCRIREEYGPESTIFSMGTGRDIGAWICMLAYAYGSPKMGRTSSFTSRRYWFFSAPTASAVLLPAPMQTWPFTTQPWRQRRSGLVVSIQALSCMSVSVMTASPD